MIWSEPLKEDGRNKYLEQEEAKKNCLELNPESERAKVSKSIQQIETNSDLIELRKKYLKKKTKENRRTLIEQYLKLKLNKENPLSGCFLPPVEELLMLSVDLGYSEIDEESEYLPRFLSELYVQQSAIRSSSDTPGDADSAFHFNLGTGRVGFDAIHDPSSRKPTKAFARCVCVAGGG